MRKTFRKVVLVHSFLLFIAFKTNWFLSLKLKIEFLNTVDMQIDQHFKFTCPWRLGAMTCSWSILAHVLGEYYSLQRKYIDVSSSGCTLVMASIVVQHYWSSQIGSTSQRICTKIPVFLSFMKITSNNFY